jgi:hypothetical protein
MSTTTPTSRFLDEVINQKRVLSARASRVHGEDRGSWTCNVIVEDVDVGRIGIVIVEDIVFV